MCLASELGDGFEPHDYIYLGTEAGGSVQTGHRTKLGVYPGCSGWVPGRVVYRGTNPPVNLRPVYGLFKEY